eukprot:COSAG01_NODE_33637_length_561_cov_0.874459_1_plen_173_part_01
MPFSYIEGLLQSFGTPTIADDGGSSMAVACSEAHFGRMFAHLGGFFRLDAARKQAEALRTTQRQPIEEWSSATSIKIAEGADAARRREGPKMSVKHAASAALSAAEIAEVISAAAVVDDAPVRKKAATARKAETALSSSESVQAVNAVLPQRHTPRSSVAPMSHSAPNDTPTF